MSADSDVLAGIKTRWTAASLDTPIPGGLHTGRLDPTVATGNQTYAQAKSEPDGIDAESTTDTAGNVPAVNKRKITITVRGVGETAVGSLLETVKTAYRQIALTVPNRTWLASYLIDEQLPQEDQQKSGEDIWMGSLTFSVWTQKT